MTATRMSQSNEVKEQPKIPVYCLQEEWIHSVTFGGKAKSFWWKFDDYCNLYIMRAFKTASGSHKSAKFVSREEIERLNKFMVKNQWFHLANNVEKLKNGNEKEGIGRFLYERLKWSTTDCQLAGHLGVIFSLSGAWEYNGKERGIKFRRLNQDWCDLIKVYYYRSIAANEKNFIKEDKMDNREIVAQTFKNMTSIYDDVGRICQVIEEKMKNHGFEPMGNKGITWETSTSIDCPDGWLHSYFARVYLKKRQPKKAVGYCIHLCEYKDEDYMKKLKQLNLALPLMNVSLLNLQKNAADLWRSNLYNCLWAAGWNSDQQEVKDNVIVFNNVAHNSVSAKAVTYFLDLLSLNSEKAIEELVVEPMKEMLSDKEDWIVKAGLPVLKIGTE